jgi:uncharacterized protein YgbK (DUF1537 family)
VTTGPVPCDRERFFAPLPPEWPVADLAQRNAALVSASGRKVVVLDDDPTGTQTVHGVYVLATWEVEDLAAVLAGPEPAIYILTNSRSLPAAEAAELNAQIARRLVTAARLAGVGFVVVSRSDSTLRGHYPAEVDALAGALEGELGLPYDGLLLAPFFLEGGRFTVDDVHWVLQGRLLVPAAQTEFARDATFGYRQSDLREWVAEKTAGRIPAAEVLSIPLQRLRGEGPAAVERILLTAQRGAVIIANAASYADLEVLVAGLLAAEGAGRRFLYRTAASFVRVRAAIPPRGLLSAAELFGAEGRTAPGLVVVGSHVERSTAQWQALAGLAQFQGLELDVPQILAGAAPRQAALRSLAEGIEAGLRSGTDMAVVTSRQVIRDERPEAGLAIGQSVSAALCEVVQRVVERVRPGFILAKGGITASDVATQGLGIRRARVLGQIAPGVPVWRAGAESLTPDLPYIVFPGNVGAPDTLRQVLEELRRPAPHVA